MEPPHSNDDRGAFIVREDVQPSCVRFRTSRMTFIKEAYHEWSDRLSRSRDQGPVGTYTFWISSSRVQTLKQSETPTRISPLDSVELKFYGKVFDQRIYNGEGTDYAS